MSGRAPSPAGAGGGQLPRWEVLLRPREGRPYQAVGTVHAADPDHALLTARTVFARRPRAAAMLVAPADACVRASAEGIGAAPSPPEGDGGLEGDGGGDAPERSWIVVRKSGHRASMVLGDEVGEVRAAGGAAALRAARALEGDEDAVAWLLVPRDAARETAPEDADPWFGPALDKTYKQQSAYGTVTAGKKPGKAAPARGRGGRR